MDTANDETVQQDIESLSKTVALLLIQQNMQHSILSDLIKLILSYENQISTLQNTCQTLSNGLNAINDSVQTIIDSFFAISSHKTTPPSFKGVIIK